ncbi:MULTISPECIES: tRNA glutamyl-Q(34) synthetase GluQRS [unclassified Devosia]|uniref:tRNA glutamyl-Q(34) synthetase GluQRS n=1 Tax=unclassified Devosia TaxID=196773 RepID=UPI0008684578|nr:MULTISPECIES: tRNA glutamyl-Q(34) synthetase GluQRS [unclassified Devosia]MBN9365062.1 tRNA glutamyl-Q(34) synthetase GluQRS [Devosia sp.]ODS85689.1 MAG: tRNA glutamyl-Q(34) synthetase GluQRS [Devosia sp. SCN 66-27]OJX21098.1 MAG: tRNA glutamyl-Q(34) synthetase GluQRS [Devosia sp. 66-14]
MPSPILRFAPSPNGLLHLGHAYSALFTSLWAEALGGRFLLRIEDIDITRSKPEFTAAIFEDLAWLGLAWEEPVMRQSDRFAIYAAAADRLKRRDLLYPCFCSRAELAAHASGTDPDGAPLYPGTCRHLPPGEARRRLEQGVEANWRLKTDDAVALTGVLTYSVAGPTPADRPQIRYARPERWGDVVLQRKGTPTSYHLSVVVDDDAEAVTHVTRGRDMEPSTDIHVLLQMLLGLGSPLYTFHKLILDAEGRKLSKSKGSPSLRSLREAGRTAEEIRRQLGF